MTRYRGKLSKDYMWTWSNTVNKVYVVGYDH